MANVDQKKEQTTLQAMPVKRKRRSADPKPAKDSSRKAQMTQMAGERADSAVTESKKKGATKSQIASRLAPMSIMSTTEHAIIDAEVYPVSYNECLLGQARTQWQFGDWDGLAKLNREGLVHHPERAKLAVLAAAGHVQQGHSQAARQFIRLAREWGCDKKLISQVLIAGVHNTLGRAAAVNEQDNRALDHFKAAIATVYSEAAINMLAQTRAVREVTKLGLLPQAAKFLSEELTDMKRQRSVAESRIIMFETELALLQHELSLAQQRQQLFSLAPSNVTQVNTETSANWQATLRNNSMSQLGQDLWVLEKTNYKRGGFFVEFGATDGVLLNNSWLLENGFGWQGICAEPNPKFYARLKQNRKCVLSMQYIGGATGKQVDFILADAFGGSQEFADSDHHRAKRQGYRAAGHVTVLTSISLNDFLEQHNAPRQIDYISIDTEGSEYEILRNFPFEKWNIRLMTIEHNFTERRTDIRALLEGRGYRCTEKQWDDWYEYLG